MFSPKENWEFNTLDIYNYTRPGPYELYFNNIRLRSLIDPGDLVEAGVFNGHTLLATALLLREMGSDKLIYGFDTFSGFPESQSKFDEIDLNDLNNDTDTYDKERKERLLNIRKIYISSALNHNNISSSINFSENDLEFLKKEKN